MPLKATFLHYSDRSPTEARLRRLAEFMGVECKTLDACTLDAEMHKVHDHELCILASASAMMGWWHENCDSHAAVDRLHQKTSSLFVYGFAPGNNTALLAATLADEQISAVRAFDRPNLKYEVAASNPEFTYDFSGLSFGPVHNDIDFAFACSSASGRLCPLVSIAGLPFWVLSQKDGCSTFLLACDNIVDLEEKTDDTLDTARYFSRLLPAAMFLRSTFKSRCWHSRFRFANFIVDDPPLKRSYGYLNFRQLASTMDKSDFASTIAFIPWNYRRTDNDVTQLFRERPERLSLCVHGCDHTTAEFSTTDLAALNSRVQLASARMNSLRRESKLSYSKIMVFPQGRFSTEALRVLKSNNYLAALNSSASPANSGADRSLTVADFLNLAVTRYGGFPIFVRRYPAGLEQFAFDLFFGKPVLVVEHHAYFKDGGGCLSEFMSRLNSVERLQWSGLQEIMMKSYLEREISNDITACRLYTNHQIIENDAERERTFVVNKCETGDVPIQNILINGQTIEFTVGGNLLEFTMRVPALSSAVVRIVYRNILPRVELGQAFASRSRVWARRMLSEFRDNILSRSDFLVAGAYALYRRPRH